MIAARTSIMRSLEWSWWLVWPLFLATVLAASVDRACGASAEVLSAWGTQSLVASGIAAIWIAAHLWFGCVMVMASARAETLEQTMAGLRQVWPGGARKVFLMGGLLLIGYLPAAVLRLGGALVSCRP